MDFLTEYKKIVEPLQADFQKTDAFFEEYLFSEKSPVNEVLAAFFKNKGKRIRSALIFLVTKACGFELSEFHYKLAFANELLHSATLIHDDIIDCSSSRRGTETLNFLFDSKLAVLTGDYLLSVVLKVLSEIEDKEIRNLHIEAIGDLVNGELNQYFNRFKVVSLEQYAEKSKNKTSKLFEAGIVSAYLYNGKNLENLEKIRNFAINFGIAFQIKNDLENLENSEKAFEDIKNGDYSAPVIFYADEKNVENLNGIDDIISEIKKSGAINRTKKLINKYITAAIENINFLEDNQYVNAIKKLCKLYLEETDESV